MATRIDPKLQSQLDMMGGQLHKRNQLEQTLDGYYEGLSPLPLLIIQAKITNAYRMLMGMSTNPWASLIVDAVQERLEVTGLDSGDKAVDDALWEVWQENQLDAESKLVIKTALIAGRSFGMVWPDSDTGRPEITFDSMSQMIIRYQEGSRRKRTSAMRYWFDDDTNLPCANLYLPDAIYKFVGPKDAIGPAGLDWEPRPVEGEEWPLANPFGFIPVVEFNVNRRLRSGNWGYARGEYQHVTSLIDRINLLTFLGLVLAFWMGFPIRAVIGDSIQRDDAGELLPPFKVMSDEIVQFEDPNTKLTQFDAADRSNLSVYAELDQLAALTKTPLTYFPRSGGISNISADTIRALEGGLVSKIPAHQATLGEAFEELLRMAGMMLDQPVILPQKAELEWSDHENRSLAERADAASKLVPILPQAAIIEYVLNLTAEQQAKLEAQQASDTISSLIKNASQSGESAQQAEKQTPVTPAITTAA